MFGGTKRPHTHDENRSSLAVQLSSQNTTSGSQGGFENLGNTCYINAVVSALLHQPRFIHDLGSSAWVTPLARKHGASACSMGGDCKPKVHSQTSFADREFSQDSRSYGAPAGASAKASVDLTSTEGAEGAQVGRLALCMLRVVHAFTARKNYARQKLAEISSSIGPRSPPRPDIGALKKEVERVSGRFVGNRQQDAHEFLGDLLNAVHDDLAPFSPDAEQALIDHAPVGATESAEAVAAEAAGRLAARSDLEAGSPALRLHDEACPWLPTSRCFHAEVEVTLRCADPSCGYERRRLEHYRDFSLDMTKLRGHVASSSSSVADSTLTSSLSLSDLLGQFFGSESLQLNCEKCKCTRAVKEQRLSSLPGVLVLHLKRFVQPEPHRNPGHFVKRTDRVAIGAPRRMSGSSSVRSGVSLGSPGADESSDFGASVLDLSRYCTLYTRNAPSASSLAHLPPAPDLPLAPFGDLPAVDQPSALSATSAPRGSPIAGVAGPGRFDKKEVVDISDHDSNVDGTFNKRMRGTYANHDRAAKLYENFPTHGRTGPLSESQKKLAKPNKNTPRWHSSPESHRSSGDVFDKSSTSTSSHTFKKRALEGLGNSSDENLTAALKASLIEAAKRVEEVADSDGEEILNYKPFESPSSAASGKVCDQSWSCPMCTLENEGLASLCSACASLRPSTDEVEVLGIDSRENDEDTDVAQEIPARASEMVGSSFCKDEPEGAGRETGSIRGEMESRMTPTEARDVTPRELRVGPLRAKYGLTAVVHHLGATAFAGHYVTSVRESPEESESFSGGSQEEARWIRFDDSVTTAVKEAEVLRRAEAEGYIYFFTALDSK